MGNAGIFLVYADISESQLKDIYFLRDKKHGAPKTCREALNRVIGLDDEDPKQEVVLDFYMDALEHCQSLQLSYEKTSTFFSIAKAVHMRAIDDRLPVDRSFTHCRDLLLQHSVHRPPYSVGVFTLEELRALSNWMLEHYFRYYKLFQYAFTPRITVDVTTRSPSDLVEKAPLLPPLEEAITDEQHNAELAEQARAEEERRAAEAEAAAAEEEEERKRRIQEEYLAAIPDEIKGIVARSLEEQLRDLEVQMAKQFKDQEEELLEKIRALEAKLGR